MNTLRASNPLRRIHLLSFTILVLTMILLCSGGLVTSHNVGMAVPDWPNTFGYNMFLFPISGWIGGVFFEHTHRLWGSFIGFLTIFLAIGLYRSKAQRWLMVLGVVALAAVILQGVLGGLRVTMVKNEIGIFHACLAQSFFCLIGLITLFTSTWWQKMTAAPSNVVGRRWYAHVAGVCSLIFLQLVMGAMMRHSHIGLAIPDFPLAYGQILPAVDEKSLLAINEERLHVGGMDTTAFQIYLQLAHRFMAVLIVCGIVSAAFALRRYPLAPPALRSGVFYWIALVVAQFCLGAATIWSDKAADIATAHMVIGALTLLNGVILAAMAWRVSSPATEQGNVLAKTKTATV